ncbi:Uma2 family endonuclease [Algiphilus sp. W345]|uniref:Uma2 family endonuclease n=1 Tax=Banduia mediterranea TaxID=3075609 RepID=A0ABU2WN69_9GAMM|nr:Uma2 family endonuclease [Algiphilus sp. W345]MDT0499271.1 Uma2 family endonuclease [Algiphilus sp. W345]
MSMQTTRAQGQAPKRHLHTVRDYYLMAQAGILRPEDRTELIDGEIIDMAPIGSAHASVVKKIVWQLQTQLLNQAILSVQDPIHLNDLSQPQPDIALLRPRPDFYRDAHPQAADVLLLIEVADSSLDYDRNTKLALYARHAIPEVWLVDLPASRVERWQQPSTKTYQTQDILSGHVAPGLLPACGIDISALF